MANVKTTEIWQDTRRNATCSAPKCQQPIVFAQIVKSLKTMPFDAPLRVFDAREVEGRIIETVDLGKSHFASCVASQAFRRSRA